MGILNAIKEKLFGKPAAEPAKTAAGTASPVSPASSSSPVMPVAIRMADAAAMKAGELVDVEAILEAAVQAKGGKLNWRESIVDLMKALDLDSSLAARKELAADLNYTGSDPDGSVEKNLWLHKELMKTLAENGGKIPKELLA